MYIQLLFSSTMTSVEGRGCIELANKAYRASEKGKDAKARYNASENARASRDKYHASEKGRAMTVKSGLKYAAKNKKKRSAKGKLAWEIKKGSIKRGCCEKCGTENQVEGHHDDYDKPLIVRWLCITHHKRWHRDNGEGINAH